MKKQPRQALGISMTDRHVKILTDERNRHQISAQLRRRIDIVLLALSDLTNTDIANELSTTVKTVRDWRGRWANNYIKLCSYELGKDNLGVSDSELRQYILTFLKDKPRSGTPKTFTVAQEQQIVALACDSPDQHGVIMTDWTHEMLAKIAIAKKIVPTISSSQIGRILKNKPTTTAKIGVLAVS